MLPHSTELHTHELHTTFLMIDSDHIHIRISYSYFKFIFHIFTGDEKGARPVHRGDGDVEKGGGGGGGQSSQCGALRRRVALGGGKVREPIILYPLYTLYCRTCTYVHPLYMYIQPYVHLTCL